MLKVIKDKDFDKISSIDYSFFTRKGGLSSGEYDSLNVNTSEVNGESIQHVRKNLNIIQDHFRSPNKVFKMKQIHQNNVFVLDDIKMIEDNNLVEADAVITKLKNVVIGVSTADCIPLLLVDKESKIISAIHVSWKTAFLNIIENTFNELGKLGSNTKNIKIIAGPSLAVDNFEIKDDFIETLKKLHENYSNFLLKKEDKTFFDFKKYVKERLSKLGIKNLFDVNMDTYSNPDLFFSYRRSCHLGQKAKYGCQYSGIMLNQ